MANNELQILLSLKDNASKELKTFQGKLQKMKPTFQKMAAVGTIAFAGITTAIGLAIKKSADFEQIEVAFTSMLGSAEKAKNMIEELAKFSAKTPFQMEDIAKATRTLIAFGVEGDDAIDKLQFLGDIAAGAQIPLGDLAQIFGKVKTKGKAMTEEILQMSERGIPIIDELAKQFNVSKEEIFDMASKSEISFDMIEKSLINLTGEGAMFEDQMGKQSKTVAGLFSTLKDNVTLAMDAIGDTFQEDIKNIVKNVTEVVQSVVGWIKANPQLVKTILLVSVGIAGLVAIAGTLGIILATVTLPIMIFVVALVAVFAIVIKLRDKISAFVQKVLKSELAVQLKYLAEVAIKALQTQLIVLWDKFKELWDLISPVVIPVLKFLAITLGVAIVGAIGFLVIAIGTLMEIFKMLISVIKWVIEKAIWFFNDMKEAWKTTIEYIPKIWDAVWEGVGNTLKTVWEGIKSVVKGGINYIIDALNVFVKAANKITSTMNIVPGVNIPLVPEIPHLAKGGIVQKPTLAMIGESGPEAVVPLKRGMGAGITVNINGGYYFSDEAAEELGNKIIDNLKLQLAI